MNQLHIHYHLSPAAITNGVQPPAPPTKPGDAGTDLRAATSGVIAPGSGCLIPTGLHIELPPGYWAKIEGRSGLSSRLIISVGGVIDNGYRGEIKVMLVNMSSEPFTFEVNDRIAQLVFHRLYEVSFEQVDTLGQTERGERGFGSSGK